MILRLVIITLLAGASCCFFFYRDESTSAQTAKKSFALQDVGKASRFAVSQSVSSMSARSQKASRAFVTVPVDLGSKATDPKRSISGDRIENVELAQSAGIQMPVPILSFDGLANSDNVNAFGLIIAPPDMVGEVGPDHYVQVVNTLFRVYSKSGQPLSNPISIKSLFADLQTPCAARNDGLPNLIYDQLADRWLISQVCSNYPPFRQMIAVSQSGDPLGAWYAYEYVMPGVKINDFPKISMWPDAYYMTTNEILGSDYAGTGVFAFDRKRMLEGDPNAGFIYFSMPASTSFPVGALPADLDGLRPPPNGTPAIIATHTATEYGQPSDAIRLFDFHTDFATPASSYLQERDESPITVALFDPTSIEGRADISQPPPGEKLDSVSDTLMPRLAYRNFGTHQALVANQTVRLTPAGQAYRAGVRVYEFRNSNGSYVPYVQSTIGDTTSSRWIASAAQDNQGNLAVQYNFATDDKPVSILYSGRLANDAANTFRGERSLIDGTGVQRGYGWRWGEYTGISVDPTDDCTFWITNGYYTLASQQFSEWGWLTRIGSFKFDECTAALTGTISGTVTNAATGQPVADAEISVSVYSRRSSSGGGYGPMRVSPGDYQIKVSKRGFRPASRNITIANGVDQLQNFELSPVPVVVSASRQITAESCGVDRTIDPGETATMELALQNNGAADVDFLNVTLRSSNNITPIGATQTYGPMPVDAPPVSRAFSFKVSANLSCGEAVSLTFEMHNSTSLFETLGIFINTGKPRIVLKENFDRTMLAALPPRWSRQAFNVNGSVDATRDWRLSTTHSTSIMKSLFSPAPNQPGVNELVSPIFQITTTEAVLSFQNWYELETTFLRNRLFDGAVLEIRIGDGPWQDILAAGGSFISGGYDGAIDACCQIPLAGRHGWSGWSGIDRPAQFETTSFKLPAIGAGQKVQLRWRVGTDLGTFREGQYIDDVSVTDGAVCSCS
jgi:hypothetical protein